MSQRTLWDNYKPEQPFDPAKAVEFAATWVVDRQGSPADFVRDMERRFGSLVRADLVDICQALEERFGRHAVYGCYMAETLHEEAIRQALGEKEIVPSTDVASIDELFRRSKRLRLDEAFAEAITFVSRLRKYSAYNNMLVYLQNPFARYWATAKHWHNEYGRTVKEDASPMVILAPMTPVLMVYEIEDTIGEPLPAQFTQAFEVHGELAEEIFRKTLDNCARDRIVADAGKLGLTVGGVAMRAVPPSQVKARIKLNQNHNFKRQYATLAHELAHVYLGHIGSDKDRWWPSRLGLSRSQREIEAEAAAFVVCRRAGLLTNSDEYVAGYIQNVQDLTGVSIDLIVKVAGYIEKMGQEKLPARKTKTESAS